MEPTEKSVNFHQRLLEGNFERDYEFCRRMYIETGALRWFNEMIDKVSPWETGG